MTCLQPNPLSIVGYLDGNYPHYLDHLAPLCSLMNWPLVITDPSIFSLALELYPDLEASYIDPLLAPFEITAKFETVLTTLPRGFFDQLFFMAEKLQQKRVKTVWLPHGNSDKGHLKGSLEELAYEECTLVYGQKMISLLEQKNALASIPHVIPIGNFRSIYAEKHKTFYEHSLTSKGIPNSFVLYAPTWKDAESSSSFHYAFKELIKHLKDAPLVVKLHPHLEEEISVICQKLKSPPSVIWVEDFPPIYPLLARATHLIGDFSSVGYDFLTFNRPMFFFNPLNRSQEDLGRTLHHYGETLSLDTLEELPLKLSQPYYQEELSSLRRTLYEHTFGPLTDWDHYAHQLLEKLKLFTG
ncbi:MAG: CDP-glycerol glycerophosphotransferase family protein [Candidatus Rhabdochlamydia sp.]